MQTTTAIPRALSNNVILIAGGAVVIAILSQARISLGFTPVPITGQSLGVILCGLFLGSRRGTLAVLTYLTAGALGAPVFAGFSSLPALWGPTSGYLIGFIPAAFIAGFLRETGWVKGFVSGTAVSLIASVPIFIIGTSVLAAFVGFENIMMMGVIPFVIGDVIKSFIVGVSARVFVRK